MEDVVGTTEPESGQHGRPRPAVTSQAVRHVGVRDAVKAPPRSLTAGAGAGFKEVVTDVRGRQELARVVKWHARLLQGVVIL